jgi:hypothetical protein
MADCTDADSSYLTVEKWGMAADDHENPNVRGSTRCSAAEGTN